MRVPGFTAEASLYTTGEHYHTSQTGTGAAAQIVPQLKCPCPPGLLAKASHLCQNPAAGGSWCNLLDHCLDCFGV